MTNKIQNYYHKFHFHEAVSNLENIKTRQAMYVQRNTEAQSRNHCCLGKAVSIIYCVCMRARVYVCTGSGVCLRAYSLTNTTCHAPYCHTKSLRLHHFFNIMS